jgi:hypothetical protein
MPSRFIGHSLIFATALGGMYAFVRQSPEQAQITPAAEITQLTLPCGSSAGVRFNLEPRTDPLPQNGTAIDFLPGAGTSGADLVVGAANDMRTLTTGYGVPPDFRGIFGISSQTGFYVHRDGLNSNPCSPDLEGGLGPVPSPATGNNIVGVGYPAVAAYPPLKAFFIADTRVSEGEGAESGIGVFRSSAARLNNSSVCPAGTLSQAESANCWPTWALINMTSSFTSISGLPHMAVDERPLGSGVGAGDVYVSATQTGQSGGNATSKIFIAACKNDLSACSPITVVSGNDYADLSHLAVRPNGGVTATYTVTTNLFGQAAAADIKYVACKAVAAPAPPVCAPPRLITSEPQAIPFNPFNPQSGLESSKFVTHTFPKHAHRQDTNGIETYVVWDRCKVSSAIPYPGLTFVSKCVDADIMMAASSDNGQTWQVAPLDTSAQDQFQPWITADPSTNMIQIGYYTSVADTLFQHRAQIALLQIPPGGATPDPPTAAQMVTTVPLEPNGDPVLQGIFIGHYIGVAARTSPAGSRVYVHYTHSSVPGIYNGVTDPEQNNHLSRIDF